MTGADSFGSAGVEVFQRAVRPHPEGGDTAGISDGAGGVKEVGVGGEGEITRIGKMIKSGLDRSPGRLHFILIDAARGFGRGGGDVEDRFIHVRSSSCEFEEREILCDEVIIHSK